LTAAVCGCTTYLDPLAAVLEQGVELLLDEFWAGLRVPEGLQVLLTRSLALGAFRELGVLLTAPKAKFVGIHVAMLLFQFYPDEAQAFGHTAHPPFVGEVHPCLERWRFVHMLVEEAVAGASQDQLVVVGQVILEAHQIQPEVDRIVAALVSASVTCRLGELKQVLLLGCKCLPLEVSRAVPSQKQGIHFCVGIGAPPYRTDPASVAETDWHVVTVDDLPARDSPALSSRAFAAPVSLEFLSGEPVVCFKNASSPLGPWQFSGT